LFVWPTLTAELDEVCIGISNKVARRVT